MSTCQVGGTLLPSLCRDPENLCGDRALGSSACSI
jgi:hypothetical protein